MQDALQQEEEILLMMNLDELKKPDEIRNLILAIIAFVMVKRQLKYTVRMRIPKVLPKK